jgi:putative transcriptional regulator
MVALHFYKDKADFGRAARSADGLEGDESVRNSRTVSTMTKKLDIFAELIEGFDALKQQREGKLTLRTNPRTLENWEQGRAKPNAQAALLIHMVARFPDMVQRLEAV